MIDLKFLSLFTVLLVLALCGSGQPAVSKKKVTKLETVGLHFYNVVKNVPLVLDDSSYTNPFGENYTVHKFKYYISNLQFFGKDNRTTAIKKYFLVNQSNDSSCNIRLQLPEGEYDSLQFLIGVDSATNSVGAQTGALDPLNDMFWTWQSGYIMQKLEGSSPQSGMVNSKIEYHLGGYGGANSTQRRVSVGFSEQPLTIQAGHKNNITIKAELNNFWQGTTNLSIKETPVCSSAGLLAKQLSFNFAGMFSLESVTNN